jgi:hypothetical protein
MVPTGRLQQDEGAACLRVVPGLRALSQDPLFTQSHFSITK